MLWYFTWYGIGRAFIETLRTDSLYLGSTDIRVSSLLGALCFVLLMPLIIIGRVRFAQMSKAGAIAADRPADFPVLLGIEKSEPTEATASEATDEEDIIEISDVPNISEALNHDEIENITESAENGDKEE